MKIKITGLPEMKMGGILADYPYAGANSNVNPFGLISSNPNPSTNASVKPVDREDANIEAEKGEVLLKFDLGGLFAINGKSHSQGGTPLKVDAGDFIFSKDKSLAITKEEKELFGFKEGGKYKKKENTPAKILSKEVDPKHYNMLLNIISDPKSDNIAKKTAELMLGKYSDKIGQVAFLQESKKDFPTGIPQFANGTAPIENPELEDADILEEQYAKFGGMMRSGGRARRNDSLQPSFQPPYQQAFKGPREDVNVWGNNIKQFGYTGDVNNENSIQQWINANAPQAAPYVYRNGLLGLNNKDYDPNRSDFNDDYIRSQFADGQPYAEDMFLFDRNNMDDYKQYSNFMNSATPVGELNGSQYYFNGARNNKNKPVFEIPEYNPTDMTPLGIQGSQMGVTPTTGPNLQPLAVPSPMTPSATPQQGRQRVSQSSGDIPWNAQEKLTTALPFLSAFMRKDQYPMLQQISTPDIRLDRISNAAEIADIKQQSALTQRELFSNMSGKNAYLNSAALRGEMINSMMRSNAQNNNVNTQISNQEDMTNYQTMINDRNFNVQAVEQNYNQNNLVLGRRQKEMADAFAQSINTGVGIQDKLDALKQVMAQSAMRTVDSNGQARFILDPNTRMPVLNPNWKGNIMDNPFLPANAANTDIEIEMLRKKFPTVADKDLLRTWAYMRRPNLKGATGYTAGQ